MGRFLIIRVIKEHNADGYQNYDKCQHSVQAHGLLYIYAYYIVLCIEQQSRNFTNLDVCMDSILWNVFIYKLTNFYFFHLK